jgi:hypothetical protein
VYQRLPGSGTQNRGALIKADNLLLFKVLTQERIDVSQFRNGLLDCINQRALRGEFVLG